MKKNVYYCGHLEHNGLKTKRTGHDEADHHRNNTAPKFSAFVELLHALIQLLYKKKKCKSISV